MDGQHELEDIRLGALTQRGGTYGMPRMTRRATIELSDHGYARGTWLFVIYGVIAPVVLVIPPAVVLGAYFWAGGAVSPSGLYLGLGLLGFSLFVTLLFWLAVRRVCRFHRVFVLDPARGTCEVRHEPAGDTPAQSSPLEECSIGVHRGRFWHTHGSSPIVAAVLHTPHGLLLLGSHRSSAPSNRVIDAVREAGVHEEPDPRPIDVRWP